MIKMRFTRCSRVVRPPRRRWADWGERRSFEFDNRAFRAMDATISSACNPIGFSSSMRVACIFLKADDLHRGGESLRVGAVFERRRNMLRTRIHLILH